MKPDFIETFTGRRFFPLSPVPDDIDIRDIAHALSQQCRFSGHTREFYSVGEHSVRVSELLEEWRCTPTIQLWGLMHDASEAYLVDIPLPLKLTETFAGYREAETRLMAAICGRFGLSVAEPERVRTADAALLATEARDLMPFVPAHWAGLKGIPHLTKIEPWSPETAESVFLKRYERLAA
jgi:hypothetical protein